MQSRSTVLDRLTGPQGTIERVKADNPVLMFAWVDMARTEQMFHKVVSRTAKDWDEWRDWVHGRNLPLSGPVWMWHGEMYSARQRYHVLMARALQRLGTVAGHAALKWHGGEHKPIPILGKGADWKTTTKRDAWRDWWPDGKVRGY